MAHITNLRSFQLPRFQSAPTPPPRACPGTEAMCLGGLFQLSHDAPSTVPTQSLLTQAWPSRRNNPRHATPLVASLRSNRTHWKPVDLRLHRRLAQVAEPG